MATKKAAKKVDVNKEMKKEPKDRAEETFEQLVTDAVEFGKTQEAPKQVIPVEEEFGMVNTSLVPVSTVAGNDATHTNKGTALADIYDKYQKLSYIIDISGSMNEQMKGKPEDKIGAYIFDEAFLQNLRTKLKAVAHDMCQGEGLSATEEVMEVYQVDINEDTDIKVWAIQNEAQLVDEFHMTLTRDHNVPLFKSKLNIVKEAAKQFVKARFQKHPQSSILVYAFDDSVAQLVADPTEEGVLFAINGMYPAGGTNIYNAVDYSIKDFKRAPSQVMAHHIVLVSDGEDYGSVKVEQNLLPRMKDLNIVFDYIFIRGEYAAGETETIKSLRRVCEATGGEFQIVDHESDFREKFLAASQRPMLGYRG